MKYPHRVKLVEVGPRDGLQNEPRALDTAAKVAFINALSETGLAAIEVAGFVSPKWVPQLADAEAVFAHIHRRVGVEYSVLVPNLKGLERALGAGARAIAVTSAATDGFCRANLNCTVAESLERLAPVIERARAEDLRVRGYVSCALGCPYEGVVAPSKVAAVAGALAVLGCEEVALADTIGAGTPRAARELIETVAARVPVERLALHFHDTRGMAIANLLAGLELGVSVIDASVAGLGGCPYAPGASGNVATEDVVYLLHGLGIETGLDLERLIAVGRDISARLGRENMSRVGRAGLPRPMAANDPETRIREAQ
jgi:hydroxymethylglutaryl-CoA lyase